MKVEIDLAEFKRAVKLYQKATKKSVPEILNHAATQAAFRGQQARFTPKAKLSGALGSPANPERPRKKWSSLKDPKLDRLFFALAAKQGKPGRAQAAKLYKRRRSSVGFVRVNWGAVMNKLGVKRTGKFPQSSDIEFKKATIFSPIAIIRNAKLEGKGQGKALSVLSPGWLAALHDAVWGPRGMVAYAQQKIVKNWKRRR